VVVRSDVDLSGARRHDGPSLCVGMSETVSPPEISEGEKG
jgi:hypothetical protein